MKDRKYYTVKILRPSGDWDIRKVPSFFDVSEVVNHCPHSEVAVFVPKRHRVYVGGQGYVAGPVDALWNPNMCEYVAAYPDITKVDIGQIFHATCLTA